ncbi:CTD KINASE SUBUNIT BETA [Ceraceosorus bombacis]|uniref:CTD KINASE SUBUNIT BETA n=1 Tax=Ceraceosorus bombacis TaxID=401625 RepID=A0A0P1BFY6_9BASI|nr:CTD KINASE SUBUNIT BETA [Ceraceosorus bombacis]
MVQVTTVYPTAYFTPAEVTFLSCVSSDQRNLSVASGFGAGAAVSSSSSSSWQPQAHSLDVKTTQSIQHLLALVQSLGAALRFPQRTCSTAQAVLLRLLLHHGANAKRMAGLLLGGGQGVAQEGQQQREALACACIALAGKLNDTNRKMRDVLLGSYKLRFPDLVRRGRVVGAGAGAGAGAGGRASNGTMFRLGNVAEADIDSNALEMERRRLLGLERMLLESVGFEFGASNRVQRTLRYLIKMMRKLGLGVGVGGQSASGSDGGAAAAAAKEARDQASHWQQEQASQHFDFESTAWQVLTDLFRTWHCLQYTPITLAITAIYATALLWQDSVVAVGVQASNGRGDNDDDDDDAVTEGQEQQEARGQRFTSRLVDAKECGCALVRRIRRVVEGLEGQEEQEQEQEQEQEHCEELRRMIRDQLKVHIEDVHEVLHGLLDMYSSSISALTTSTPYTTPATPATPASPSDQLAHLSGNANASSITTHRAGRPTARPQANKSFQTATAAQQVESENHWFRLAREAQADVLGHGQVERRNASGSSGGKEAKNKARSLPKEAVAPPPLGLLALFEKEQSALFVATGTSGARARGHGTNMQAVRGNRTAAGPATSATRGATSVSELLSCIMELKIALREREDERLKRDLRLLGLLGGPLEEKKEDHGASSGRLIDQQEQDKRNLVTLTRFLF